MIPFAFVMLISTADDTVHPTKYDGVLYCGGNGTRLLYVGLIYNVSNNSCCITVAEELRHNKTRLETVSPPGWRKNHTEREV